MFDTTFETIIIGTGPGGASVACELTKKRKKVLMLEWGNDTPFDGSIRGAVGIIGVPGRNFAITSEGMIVGKATTVGGSTSLYCATAYPPPFVLFEKYGINLKPEIEEIRRELPIGRLRESLVGPQAKAIANAARDLGLRWEPFDKFIFQDHCRLGCFNCFTGCPHQAKWTARNYAHDAVQNGATLLTRSKVVDLIIEGDTAKGVRYSYQGSLQTAQAGRVVVAAGGIGTPILLRKAGIREAGRNLFVDPLVIVFGLLEGLPGGGEVPMTGGVHLPDEGILMADLPLTPLIYRLLALQKMRLKNAFRHKRAAGIMVKVRDDLSGEITDTGRIRKVLSADDRKRIETGYNLARGILEKAGAKEIFRTMILAGHPGGTARIGDVVDADLMTRYKNLYVSDCSVIPEAWGLPPTLTLLSLGKHLARHLQ